MSLARAGESSEEAIAQIGALHDLEVIRDAPLSRYTRFGIGGPADFLLETGDPESFFEALRIARSAHLNTAVIGGGTNLIVSDNGFRGLVLKLANTGLRAEGNTVFVDGGVPLQTLVDFTIDRGLKGLETMTGIPGWTGAAIYGNAGAYGRSIAERVVRVRFFDGAVVRECSGAECEFHYRQSVFKSRKDWIVLSAELSMESGDAAELRAAADRILGIRNKKYPPTMKCAGSIFKNLLIADLPPRVAAEVPPATVIEGKVPSAWFLEQVGAKGMRSGGIVVADYHANLIYNTGDGSAGDLVAIISELKQRVDRRWGIPLEEEVQYVGFTK